jgi:hypothetical protein
MITDGACQSMFMAAYDVYVWDQCFAMEQSLRID